MPKRPFRNANNPTLTKRQPQRSSGKWKLVCMLFGTILLLLISLSINLFHRAEEKNRDAAVINTSNNNVPPKSRLEKAVTNDPPPPKAESVIQREPTTLEIFTSTNCQGTPIATGTADTIEPVFVEPPTFPKSVRIKGKGLAEAYIGANYEYRGTVMEVEGCVRIYESVLQVYGILQGNNEGITKAKFVIYSVVNSNKVLTAKRQIPPNLQKEFATVSDLSQPHTRFVFSCTSSKYFSYQVYANALGFLESKQTQASWTRLMSSSQVDDLAEKFPTFTAPKSLYDVFYQPINKADVIDKWFHSADAPHPDDTIVVIDPDNWLINDLHGWAKRVTPKNAMCQAAYYSDTKTMLQELWQDLCRTNCHIRTDPGAVPYVLKASDLKAVAPLWREYSIDIKERFKYNVTFKAKYGPGLGVNWAAEMFGFNFASTHLGIATKIVSDMQLRDVDGGKRNWPALNKTMPMIHMGRAWFPKDNPEAAAPWRSAEDNEPASIAASGIQVWCKCNDTAALIQPWPLPNNMDFVSYHTLRLLHDSIERFGPIPINEKFRREQKVFNRWSFP